MTSDEVAAFLESFRALMMASLSSEGEVHASTAPFVRFENDFYVLISTVAQHGRNLLVQPNVSLLFAEDESVCTNPFARKRVTVDAAVVEIAQDESRYQNVLDVFKSRFDSELVTALTQMADFHLFRLSPRSGSAVMGFGKAYGLDQNLCVQSSIRGHHHTKEKT